MNELTMVLPDIRVNDPSALKGKFLHLEIHHNRLVMELDFDSGQFAIITVLQLMGMNTIQSFKTSKKIMDGKTNAFTEIEKRNFEIKDWKLVFQIIKDLAK